MVRNQTRMVTLTMKAWEIAASLEAKIIAGILTAYAWSLYGIFETWRVIFK